MFSGFSSWIDDGFALVFQLAGGTTLRLTRVEGFTPQPFTVLDWTVDDIDATVRELALRRVAFESYGQLEQDELAIWTALAQILQ